MTEQAVTDFLHDYAKVLSRADAQAMANRWNVPALVIGGGQAIAVSAASQTEEFFARSFEHYHQLGIHTAVLGESRVTMLSDSVAAVGVHWVHQDAGGNRVGSEDAFYVLAHGSEPAGIRVVFYTEAPSFSTSG